MTLVNPPVGDNTNTNANNMEEQGGLYLLVPKYVNIFEKQDYDSYLGIDDTEYARKQMTDYIMYRVLDKWLYSSKFCDVLKYLKVSGNSVKVLSKKESKLNKISNDTIDEVEMKIDYIHENILSERITKLLLKKIVIDLEYKWYQLYDVEPLVASIICEHIKKKLKGLPTDF